MPRWSEKLGNSVNFAVEKVNEDTFLENFHKDRSFHPATEQEQREFDDFSFVSAAMALAVYIASKDDKISAEEEKIIIDELLYQIEINSKDYELIAEEFGIRDKRLIDMLYRSYKNKVDAGQYNVDKDITLLNKYYENNPYKKNYLARVCYIVAFTESGNIGLEVRATDGLCQKLKIPDSERERLKKEAKDIAKKNKG